MNPRAGTTDLLVFEARPFSRLGTPPEMLPLQGIGTRRFATPAMSSEGIPKMLRICLPPQYNKYFKKSK